MSAENIYLPTVLMVKRHNKTGKLYFHKTSRLNLIESYEGSGKHWRRHLKKHGNDWSNIWVSDVFYDKEDLVEFALFFSEFFNMVESDDWANMQPENGLDGYSPGSSHREESKKKTSQTLLETRKTKSWGFSETGKRLNDKRIKDGSHQTLDPDWQKKNNPFLSPEWQQENSPFMNKEWQKINNPSNHRWECSITGIVTTKAGFAKKAKKEGYEKWPHEIIRIK